MSTDMVFSLVYCLTFSSSNPMSRYFFFFRFHPLHCQQWNSNKEILLCEIYGESM
ncbi:rCG59128 [Rattus norvegicus]|uniref:RCG59128 n=1 Tax=Rattus norvegicus TaxID=10116 RepID=A6KU08_RAT|nr:rCG59128 [Rattus norvegicus]